MIAAQPWTVLLIGGSSGTGKTTAARMLGLQLGVPWAQVDDVRLVLQRMTTADQHPILHEILAADADPQTPATTMRDRLIAAGEVVSHALEIVIANHVATHAPLILEGDGLLPALAARTTFADLPTNNLRAVFVVENDPAALHETMWARDRGFRALSAAAQARQTEQSWLYGQWLRDQAVLHELPVVAARPWMTLSDRILAAL